ncbi:hypothetical protein V8C37DRAFT_367017 [Trichoderma ceciliae]
MVDACDFFNTHDPSQKWPNSTSLVLTSQLLAPDESHTGIMDMLQRAGLAAARLPKLKTMEIWNGREKLAALFEYELLGEGQPASITWRATWDFILQPQVITTWEAVTTRRHGSGLIFVYETLSCDEHQFDARRLISCLCSTPRKHPQLPSFCGRRSTGQNHEASGRIG